MTRHIQKHVLIVISTLLLAGCSGAQNTLYTIRFMGSLESELFLECAYDVSRAFSSTAGETIQYKDVVTLDQELREYAFTASKVRCSFGVTAGTDRSWGMIEVYENKRLVAQAEAQGPMEVVGIACDPSIQRACTVNDFSK